MTDEPMDRLTGRKGPLSRTKFRSPAFHQVLPLKHLSGTSSPLTYLQQQAAPQASTFFCWLLFHTPILNQIRLWTVKQALREDLSKHFNSFHRNPVETADLEEKSSKLKPKKCQTENIRDWLNTNSSHYLSLYPEVQDKYFPLLSPILPFFHALPVLVIT